MKLFKKFRKRFEILENIISKEITKADIHHLEYTEQFEIVAMFHIESRIVMPDEEYYRYNLDLNSITGQTAFEYLIKDMKRTVISKLKELTFSEKIVNEIKIYVNKPLRVKK